MGNIEWTANDSLSELRSLVRLDLMCVFCRGAYSHHRSAALMPEVLSTLRLRGSPRIKLDLFIHSNDFDGDASHSWDFVNWRSMTESLLSLYHITPAASVIFCFFGLLGAHRLTPLANAVAMQLRSVVEAGLQVEVSIFGRTSCRLTPELASAL